MPSGIRHLQPGSCPDSWGVWFADDPRQTPNSNTLGKVLAEEHGLKMRFHPHADYHVETQAQTEQFLEETDPAYVSLCLDTGHLAYRRADVPSIIRKYPDRIGKVHIKQMNPVIAQRALAEDLPFGQAVAQGAGACTRSQADGHQPLSLRPKMEGSP